jgi:hypothetical protein
MKFIFVINLLFIVSLSELQSQTAPVTIAGMVTGAIPGDQAVPVPVSVTDFIDIGQFTLTLKFDTTRVRYVSASPNPSLSGMTVTYSSPSGNTQGKLVFAWTGASNLSLPDGTSLAGLTFHYVTGTGNLTWSYILGSICQYKRFVNGSLTLLTDAPKYLYYINGGISNRTAPVTFAPTLPDPVPGSLSIPVTANNFTSIGGFTLSLEYDPAVITYMNTYSKNPVFGSSFQVGDNPGTNGKRQLVIQWFGTAVSLPNGSTLCTLNFNYPEANCNPCSLAWYDIGPSCEYTDGGGDVLIDLPQPDFYLDGIIASGLINTWTGAVSNEWDDSGNWNNCGIPDITRDIIIPDVSPFSFPVVSSGAFCNSIHVDNGATLIIEPGGFFIVGAD